MKIQLAVSYHSLFLYFYCLYLSDCQFTKVIIILLLPKKGEEIDKKYKDSKVSTKTIINTITSGGEVTSDTVTKDLNTDTKVNSILLKVEDTSDIDRSILNVENSVRSEFQISTDYFTVTSNNSILESMDNITNTLTLLLGGIASISLIVGGIGVMNVMLVSVSVKTKEIGIRESLGAKRKDIMYQFLIESLMLCIIGLIFGIFPAYKA